MLNVAGHVYCFFLKKSCQKYGHFFEFPTIFKKNLHFIQKSGEILL